MPKLYIASSLHNADRVKELILEFQTHGVEITYDWTVHGQVFSEDLLKKIGELELDGVMRADVLFFLQPGRSGSHVELGIMLANMRLNNDKKVVMLDDCGLGEQKTFYYVDGVLRFDQKEAAVDCTLELLGLNNGNIK